MFDPFQYFHDTSVIFHTGLGATMQDCILDGSLFVSKAAVSCTSHFLWRLLVCSTQNTEPQLSKDDAPTSRTNITNITPEVERASNSLLAPLHIISGSAKCVMHKEANHLKCITSVVDLLCELCGTMRGDVGCLRMLFEEYDVIRGLMASLEETDCSSANLVSTLLDVLMTDACRYGNIVLIYIHNHASRHWLLPHQDILFIFKRIFIIV